MWPLGAFPEGWHSFSCKAKAALFWLVGAGGHAVQHHALAATDLGSGMSWGSVYRYASDRLQGQEHQPRSLTRGSGPPTHLPNDLMSSLLPHPLPSLSPSASSHLKMPSLDTTSSPSPIPRSLFVAKLSCLHLPVCSHLSLSLSTQSLSHCFPTSTHHSEESPLANVPSNLQDPVSTLF